VSIVEPLAKPDVRTIEAPLASWLPLSFHSSLALSSLPPIAQPLSLRGWLGALQLESLIPHCERAGLDVKSLLLLKVRACILAV
jgi:hypothetical protein